jgi:uncharacterized protein
VTGFSLQSAFQFESGIMLVKLILLALAVWMVLLLLKQYKRGMNKPRPSANNESQDMVSCQACGLHLPKAESILKQGSYYCCKEHSDKAGQ